MSARKSKSKSRSGGGKFKGGVYVNPIKGRADGSIQKYLRISAGPQRDTYVHVLVAEAMIGRKLTPDETVEHKNGNGLDCDPGNLMVVTRAENTRRLNDRVCRRGEYAESNEEPVESPAEVLISDESGPAPF